MAPHCFKQVKNLSVYQLSDRNVCQTFALIHVNLTPDGIVATAIKKVLEKG